MVMGDKPGKCRVGKASSVILLVVIDFNLIIPLVVVVVVVVVIINAVSVTLHGYMVTML